MSLVKAASHRARGKLLALVGEDNAEAVCSLQRELGKGGAFRIPESFEAEALEITGITRLKDGEDLLQCWKRV
jgi:hypothetical protein